MTADITLTCPCCDTKMQVAREDTDPPESATVIMVCLHCDDGDFHSPRFENADGFEIPPVDPMTPTSETDQLGGVGV